MPSTVLRRFGFAVCLALPLAAAPGAPGAASTSDDAEFLFRLGLMEGHLMVGHELLDARQNAFALPHFGHPVRELYDDIRPWLRAHRVAPFDGQLVDLEAAVAKAPQGAETRAKYQAVLDTLRRAREAAPAELRASVPAQIRICAETVEAAAGEYGEALNRGRIDGPVEYHDSRGYLSWVAQHLSGLEAGAAPEERGLLARFREVLARAQRIVAPLVPPQPPIAGVGEYRAIAKDARVVADAAPAGR